jgi:rhodanese-related sulfurtransferase
MASANAIRSTVDDRDLPNEKQTTLGLYLTASDAATALQADPTIVFLDVRDPIEIAFVGHPTPIDANVPIAFATHNFDITKGSYRMEPNKDFLIEAEVIVARKGGGTDRPVFVMCRSGGRSAVAANTLAAHGFTNVWNVVEGFEGDTDTAGTRSVNGWRNAGLPWVYGLSAEQAWRPSGDRSD